MDLGEGERILAVDPGRQRGGGRRGAGCTITVRPEWIKLAGAGGRRASRASHVGGTVVDVVYLGSVTQMIVILRTGERLTVHRLNDEVGAVEPRPGDRVILHWDAAHSFVIGTPRRRRDRLAAGRLRRRPGRDRTPGLIEGRKCERWARTTDR